MLKPSWLVAGFAASAAVVSPAWAHRVKVSAFAEGTKVFCYGYLTRGGNVKDRPIKVLLPDGTTLVEGKTDEEGRFTFEAAVRADLRIVLDAGAGHRAECTLPAADLPDDLPGPRGEHTPPPPSTADMARSGPEAGPHPAPRPDTQPSTQMAPAIPIDEERMRQIVRAEVQRAVRPLREELETEKGPGPTEIIGGIGYILGLMGIAAYFRSRTAPKKRPGSQ